MPGLCVATLTHQSGLPEDNFVNTFAIRTEAGYTVDNLFGAAVMVSEFYFVNKGLQPGTVHELISTAVSRGASQCRVDVYDLAGHLDGTPHGSPVADRLFTMGAALGTSSLPAEVAVGATLLAVGRAEAPVEQPDGPDPGGLVDRPKQRHTGRIYVGPLRNHIASETAGRVRVANNHAATIGEGLVSLNTELATVPNILGLGVWSRVDGVMRELAAVFVDDAFDTQRRRGEAASTRTTFPVV